MNFITNAMTAIHEFGAKGFWQSLAVLVAVTVLGNVADHYLGVGNAVTSTLKTLEAPVSPTIVVSGTTAV